MLRLQLGNTGAGLANGVTWTCCSAKSAVKPVGFSMKPEVLFFSIAQKKAFSSRCSPKKHKLKASHPKKSPFPNPVFAHPKRLLTATIDRRSVASHRFVRHTNRSEEAADDAARRLAARCDGR